MLESLRRMDWRPIPPPHYLAGVLSGLALGVVVASLAIWAAILTA